MKTRLIPLVALSLLAAGVPLAHANPAGETVQAGSATFNRGTPGSLIVNQATDRVVIDWNSFSINAGEITRFIQPGANAAALNRVLGGSPTAIYGNLVGNGNIYVINPAGILVGPRGVINTHGFIGSTLDVDKANFMRGGSLLFNGSSTAGVRNEGTINALGGDIFLLSRTVENAGALNAARGTVGLGAGSEILLSQSGTERISIRAGNLSAPAATGVDNEGRIQAINAELQAAGGNIYALAINNGGVVRANTVVNEGGRILLKASGGTVQNSGTLDASGTRGGKVQVLGENVTLASGSTVNVSGEQGGGVALIGGDFRGNNPAVLNAQNTTVAAGAVIRADATRSGNAGTVVVWADDTTVFGGSIYARALAGYGNGGFAEVSGEQNLAVSGRAYLNSARGRSGTLLLDPGTVTLVNGPLDATGQPNVFNDAWVIDHLNNSGNLIITTANGTAGAEDLIVNGTADAGGAADVTWNSANSLTLIGNNSVSLNAGSVLANSGSGALNIQSGGAVQLNGTITLAGNLAISTAGSLAFGGATFTAGNVDAWADNNGTGENLTFANATVVNATVQAYRAGSGAGNTAAVSFHPGGPGDPEFRNTAGTGPTTTFTYRQDAAIADGDIPDPTQFGNGTTVPNSPPATYAIRSDGGGIAISTEENFAGSALTLTANGALTFSGGGTLAPASLVASASGAITVDKDITASSISLHAGTDGSGNLTFEPNADLHADTQSYRAGDGPVGAATTAVADLVTDSPDFRNSAGDAAPTSFTFWQDAAIASGDVAVAARFGGTLPGSYTIRSDDGSVALPALALPGTLSVTANGTITDAGNISVVGTTTLAAGAGNNITLDNADNFGGTVTITSGNDVTLNDTGAIDLGASTISGFLAVTAGGAITDSGNLAIGGAVTLAAGSGNNITLNNANTFGGTVTITSGNDVTLVDGNALDLGASTISGFLNVTANGAITDSGNLTVGGSTTLAAGSANNITLDEANDFNTVTIVSGNDVALEDTDGIDLGGPATIGGTLDVTAGGNITQSGGLLSVGGLSTFTITAADSDVLVGSFANLFNDVTLALSGGTFHDIAIWDASLSPNFVNGLPATLNDLTLRYDNAAVDLTGFTINGNLDVRANGITDSGAILVTGTTTLTAGAGNNIVLDAANNFGGALSIVSANNVTLNDLNGVVLGGSTISGFLNLTAAGNVTQVGLALGDRVSIGGLATFAIGANNITLNNANNDFATVTTSTGDVTLSDVDEIELGAMTLTGNLNVTANGAITDSGNLIIGGTTTLAAGAANNITLDNDNNFGGTVSLTTGNNVRLNDVNAIDFGASTVSGTLNVTAVGDITDSGSVSVAGLATLAPGAANSVVLDEAGNNFNSVTVPTAVNLTLVDQNAIVLGAVSLSGNLDVTAGGNITQVAGGSAPAGPLAVTGNSSFTVNGSAANRDILLASQANNFAGTITLAEAGSANLFNVALRNVNNIPAWPTLPAGLNDLTLVFDNTAVTLPGLTLSGNLTVTAGGAIAQAGLLDVDGAANFTVTSLLANNYNVTLDSFANDFGGAVTFGTAGNASLFDLALRNVNASASLAGVPANGLHNFTVEFDNAGINLPGFTLSGNLKVTAGGNISQSGAIVVNTAGSTAEFYVTAPAPASYDVLLGTAHQNNLLSVTIGALNSASVRDLALRNVNSGATLAGLPLVGLRNLGLYFDNAAITLPALTVSGDLSVTAGGSTGTAVGQSALVTVGGNASFTALPANQNITLVFPGLDVAGTIALHSLADAYVINANGLRFAESAVGSSAANTLAFYTPLGGISQVGKLVLGGSMGIYLENPANQSVNLNDPANAFPGAISFYNSPGGSADPILNNLTLVAVTGLQLSPNGTLTVNGALNLSAAGPITQTGPMLVSGATALSAGAGNNITLNAANDFIGAVSIASGNNVSLTDLNSVLLGGSTISGNLSLTAAGNVSQSGLALGDRITINGLATFAIGPNDLTLNNANNDFATVTTSTDDVILNDVDDIDLGAMTLTGNLTVTAGSHITQSGLLNVAGLSSFTVTGPNSDLILGSSFANLFNGGVALATAGGSFRDIILRNAAFAPSLSGTPGTVRDFTLRYDNAGVDLPAVNVTGNLDVQAAGNITDSGNVIVAGSATLAAGAGNDIVLNNANDFSTVTITSGRDVTLNDVNALTVGGTVSRDLSTTASGGTTFNALSVGRNFSAIAGGLISDAGNLTIAGATTLAAGAGNDIVLNNADDFGGPVTILSARDVTLNDVNGLEVGGTINRDLTTTAAGATTLDASGIGRNLSVTANGLVSDAGNVTVGGTTTLAAGAGNDITLNDADDFGGVVTIASGRNVTLNDVNDLTVGGTVSGNLTTTAGGATTFNASSIAGNLNATANGLISDAGNVIVSGATTLAAGAGNDITLNDADDFGGAVTIASGRDVTLNDVNDLTVGGTVSGNLTTTAGGATTFNASSIAGNLNTTASGLISDAGNVSVSGATTLAAGAGNDITLNDADDFGGAVTIGSGRNVTLNDVNDLTVGGTMSGDLTTTAGGATTLNASSIAGSLNVTANGLISDAGNVSVSGGTTLAAGAGNDITLDNADDFGGAVSITSGRNVTVNDVNDLTVGGTVSGDLTTTAGGATTLNASSIAGNLNTTASGLISDAGAVTVGGATTLAAGAGNDIVLNDGDDFVGAVTITSARDATVNDVNNLVLGGTVSRDLTTTAGGATTLNASTIGRDLSVTANGLISDAGNVTVGGATTLAAGAGNDITLNDADDFGGAVTIASGRNVAINDVNDLTVGGIVSGNLATTAAGATTLNASTISGNLNVAASGLISDAGNVTVSGTTALAAGAGNDIVLDNADDFGGAVTILSARDATLNDVNGLVVGGTVSRDLTSTAGGGTTFNALNVAGNLNSTAAGLVQDAAALVIGGATTIAAGAGNDVILDNADDFGGKVTVASGRNLTITDINNLTLGGNVSGNVSATPAVGLTFDGLSVGGVMTATASGLISDAGFLRVAGMLTLTSTGNDIDLDNTANDFTETSGLGVTATAQNITLADSDGFNLGAISAPTGTLDLRTDNGDVIQLLNGTVVQAHTLEGDVNGRLILGNPADDSDLGSGNVGDQIQRDRAYQPLNQFAFIGDLQHEGLYLFDSFDALSAFDINNGYGAAIRNPFPITQGNNSPGLGLVINGNVVGSGKTVIRTEGDLVLSGRTGEADFGAGLTRVRTVDAWNIELSAEQSGNFHNILGFDFAPSATSLSVAGVGGQNAIQASGRFLVFSTTASRNFHQTSLNQADPDNALADEVDPLNNNFLFNKLRADDGFAESLTYLTRLYDPGIVTKTGDIDPNETFTLWVFADPQARSTSTENANFFNDLLRLVTFSGVDATARLGELPQENPPTVWTSSYHIYLEESKAQAEEKRKRGRKTLAEFDSFSPADLGGE